MIPELVKLIPKVVERLDRIEILIQTPKGWLTLKQACNYSGLGARTLRRAVDKGKLRCSKQTGKLLFKPSWIDRFILFGKQRITATEKLTMDEQWPLKTKKKRG